MLVDESPVRMPIRPELSIEEVLECLADLIFIFDCKKAIPPVLRAQTRAEEAVSKLKWWSEWRNLCVCVCMRARAVGRRGSF